MAEGDSIEYRATLGQTDALLREMTDTVKEQAAKAQAMGDEVTSAALRAQVGKLSGPSSEEIEASVAAQQRLTQAKQAGAKIDAADLDVIRETTAALERQTALRAGLQRESMLLAPAATQPERGIVLPPERRALSAEQLAGAQVAAQERAAIGARLVEQPTAAGPLIIPDVAQRSALPIGDRMKGEEAQARLNDQVARETALREEALATARAQSAELARIAALQAEVDNHLQLASASGQKAASQGMLVPAAQRERLMASPSPAATEAGLWGADETALARYNVAQGEYETFAQRASIQTEGLGNNLTRLGVVQSKASNEMRAHGALTTEWLGALARGETTVSEFGYQIGATVGKFAGWTAAAGLTYGALGALVEFGKGAIDSSNAVAQLKRTIDNLDTDKAAQAIRSLSQNTDVSVKEAGDAVFQFSRTFGNVSDAAQAAGQGLSVLQLDNVALTDSVKLSTALHQQYGLSVAQLGDVYDMVASGQREYNARISEMVPLLQKSSGAVRNAGGDLTQLIQLGTVGLRLMPGLGGSQLGTALYRGAATFTRKNAAALVSQYGLGADINPLTGQGNVTQLIMDAIKESANMAPNRRQNLANLIFGPQYGGRTAAFFSPQSADLLNQVTSGGKRAITPGATRGMLDEELRTQLDQVRKQMDQFVNGLQRLGSALAQTGALAPLGMALRAVVGSLSLVTDLVDAFNSLPAPLRQTVSLLVEARTAFLLLTRTRMGASVPGGAALARLPGFGNMADSRMRGELSTGIRASLQRIQRDIESTASDMIANGTRQAELQQQQALLEKKALAAGGLTAAEKEESNALSVRIIDLQTRGNQLQAQLNAQQALQEVRQSEMNAVSATRFSGKRLPQAQVKDMYAAMAASAGSSTAATEALGADDAAIAADVAAKRALAVAIGENAAATTGLAATTTEVAAVTRAEGMTTAAAAEATGAAAGASVAAAGAEVEVGGFAAGLGRFALALDPLTIGLIALPIALQFLMGKLGGASKQQQAIDKLLGQTATSMADFEAQTRQLGQLITPKPAAPKRPPKPATNMYGGVDQPYTGDLPGVVRGSRPYTGDLPGLVRGPQSKTGDLPGMPRWFVPPPAKPRIPQAELPAARAKLDTTIQAQIARFTSDAKALSLVKGGQDKADKEFAATMTRVRAEAAAALPGRPTQQKTVITAAFNDLSAASTAATNAALGQGPGSSNFSAAYAKLAGLPAATIEKHIASLDNASKVYGVKKGGLSDAVSDYAVLVDQYRNASDDPASMQALGAAQSSLVSVINKQAQDYLHAASIQPTSGAQIAGIQKAVAFTTQSRATIEQTFTKAIAYAKQTGQGATAIKQLQDAEAQALSLVADAQKQTIDALLAAMQSRSAVQVSKIQGISPADDLKRAVAAVDGPGGLAAQLALAKKNGDDAQTINDLTTKVNDAHNQNAKQAVQNSEGLLQSQEQLATSQITGVTPADDLARARQNVANARQYYDSVKGSGQGLKATLDAQNSLNQAIYALNQQLVSNAQTTAQDAASLIDAQGQLQQANTLDPIQQAREQLATDIKVLGTIRPSQFKTYKEYQAAFTQQQAKVAQDQRGVTSQIVSTQMSTLQFQLDTQQITGQQYMDGLKALLNLHRMTKQQVQQIQGAIFNAAHAAAVNLNVGGMQMPTTYEVRRATAANVRNAVTNGLRGGGAGQAGQSAVVQNNHLENHVTMTVYVSRDVDLKKFTDAMHGAVQGGFDSAAMAAGMIGS